MNDPITHALLILSLVLAVFFIFRLATFWLGKLAAREDLPSSERKPREDAVVTGAACFVITALGFFTAAEAALTLSNGESHGIFVLLYAGAACLAGGAAVGFLFGIPHSGATVANDGRSQSGGYQASTSLEQIADWLTKIIVGIGLVESNRIFSLFKQAVTFLAGGLGTPITTAKACAATTLVFFPIIGFLGCYLITRLYLAAALVRADSDAKGAFEKAGVSPKAARDFRAGSSDLLFALLANRETGTTTLSDTARETLDAMAKVEFKDLKTAEEFLTWGIAKLQSGGGITDAQKALLRATELQPGSAESALAYAVALNEGGAPGADVEKVLRKALENVTKDTNRVVCKNIYKSLTYRLLYRTDAYDEVIRLAEDFRKMFPAAESGGILVNLACAYGQKLKALRQAAAKTGVAVSGEIGKEIKNKALESIRSALAIDNEWTGKLRLLLYRDHPAKVGNPALADENDLEIFADDVDFRNLIPPPEPAK